LRVRCAFAGESCDLRLLCGESMRSLRRSRSCSFARRQQLGPCAVRESISAGRAEYLVRRSQLLTCVLLARPAPKPLAEEEVGARQLSDRAGSRKALDGLSIKRLRFVVARHQRASASPQPKGKFCAARGSTLRQPFERSGCNAMLVGA